MKRIPKMVFNGENYYRTQQTYARKTDAQKAADRLRGNNFNARVVKSGGRYVIFFRKRTR